MWWLLVLSFSAFAQDEIDLEAVRELGKEIPPNYIKSGDADVRRDHNLRYTHPYKKIDLDSILKSGTEYGYVKQGQYLNRISDNKAVLLTESFYGKFFKLQDEHGFKYIQSNDGTCIYKVNSDFFVSIQEEISLYVPPLKYTPAPVNLVKSDYDKKLIMLPEFSFYAGLVKGDYMRDLFNDERAASGTATQYGFHLFTNWNIPIQVGGVVHYEKTSYDLSGGGNIQYSAPSFGPQFKSRDIDFHGKPLRFQAQFRVSPFAKAFGQTSRGDVTFKFNSADLLLSADHPVKNRFGDFLFGIFLQNQWLNIKDQPEAVSIKASNESNKSFGLSLSQVFQ